MKYLLLVICILFFNFDLLAQIEASPLPSAQILTEEPKAEELKKNIEPDVPTEAAEKPAEDTSQVLMDQSKKPVPVAKPKKSLITELVYIDKAKGKDVSMATVDAIVELAKNAIKDSAGYKLSDSKKKAKFIVKTMIISNKENYTFKILKQVHKKVSNKNGKKKSIKTIYKDSFDVAQLEDLDLVVGKVVISVLQEKKTDSKTILDALQKKASESVAPVYNPKTQYFIRFGPSWASQLNTQGDSTFWEIGYVHGIALILNWHFL